jgi:competence protein ComEC
MAMAGLIGRAVAAGAGIGATALNRLAACAAAERDRWFLWLPVALGAGIGLYFELDREPPLWPAATLASMLAALAWLVRRREAACVLAIGLAAIAAGFALAKVHTERVAAPMLREATGPVWIEGRVLDAEPTHRGLRIVVAPTRIERVAETARPERVRLTLNRGDGGIEPGDRIRVRAMLFPPAPPAVPGAYDFQRHAFFLGIGGVGYAIGAPQRLAAPAGEGFVVWLDRQRKHVTERIVAALPEPYGALAAAQITGHRGTIPPEAMQAMQDSGLAHLLAISGMNIGIVAGLIFFALRLGFAAVPALALRFPVKKWAAIGALAGALVYVAISGASVPTQRAWLMLAAVMLAVLVDREALTMRLVAWAAIVVLAVAPDALLGASFEMSFAAVIALVACYERYAVRADRPEAPRGLFRRVGRVFLLLALTSLIASAATAPFAVYSFNRVPLYGIAANMIAVPITDLWIMPTGLVAMLLMPFGLEAWPLAAMGWGVAAVLGVAEAVAGWPGAVQPTGTMPGWGLLVFALGGLWLAIWTRAWRWAGVPVMAFGLASLWLTTPPDVFVSSDGQLVAVRGEGGTLLVSSDRARRFDRETWQRRDGGADIAVFPARGEAAGGRLACDDSGCVYAAGGRAVALPRRAEALIEDCAADAVILSLAGAVRCPAGSRATVIDRARLGAAGSHALWLTPKGVRVVSDRDVRGIRPWVTLPREPVPDDPAPGPGTVAR